MIREHQARLSAIMAAFALVLKGNASDWPQLLGPRSDAVYTGPALAEQWPKEGPHIMWSAEIGDGYSSPVVSDGRLVIAHRRGDDLIVDCLDAKAGGKQWSLQHAMKFQDGANFDSGPRPTRGSS